MNEDFNFVIENFDSLIEKRVKITGRVIAIRKLKLSTFFDIEHRGRKLQIRTTKRHKDIPVGSIIAAQGVCRHTTKGHRTVDDALVEIVTKWQLPSTYSDIQDGKQGPLRSFIQKIYPTIYFAQVARNSLRKFLQDHNFLEVQTPILTRHYNGGRSIPVGISYFNEHIGYCRTTFEDRMQAYIAAGFEKIFQIGSIFRSGKERTLLEGYCTSLNFDEGIQFMKNIMAHVVSELNKINPDNDEDPTIRAICQQNWIELNFLEEAATILNIGRVHIAAGDAIMLRAAQEKNLIEENTTFETIGEKLGFAIAQQHDLPVILKHFPVWSSPLYKHIKEDCGDYILRGRMYFKTQTGLHRLEFGIQENDYQSFIERTAFQRQSWDLPQDDPRIRHSDLSEVIGGGMPPSFGFAIDPDWLLTLFGSHYSIDIYNEI